MSEAVRGPTNASDDITELLRRNREEVLAGKPVMLPRRMPAHTPPPEPPVADAGPLLDHASAVETLTRRYTLTPRESEVLALLLLGRDNLSIASRLTIKLRTAKTHVEHIWQKTGVGSRAQLMGLLFGQDENTRYERESDE